MQLHEPDRQAMRVRIVLVVVRHALPAQLGGPGLERQRLLHAEGDVPELTEDVGDRAIRERRAPRAADAEVDPRRLSKKGPHAGQIGLAGRRPGHRRVQIDLAVGSPRRSRHRIRRPLSGQNRREDESDREDGGRRAQYLHGSPFA